MNLQKSLTDCLNENLKSMVKSAEHFPWEDPKCYADLMAQTYYYSRHTTRILALAGVHFGFDRHSLHNRFLKHSAEEKGHEKLALNDIRHLGFDIEQDFYEHPNTQALYQSQYYWVQHVDPASIYGYILSLEAYAVEKCRWMYEKCKDIHGEKTASFWKVHADEDPDHVEKAIEHVSQMDGEILKKIQVNLEQTAFYYRHIYENIKQDLKSTKKSAA